MTETFEGRPLHRIFTTVPKNYDIVNRIFTLRLDEGWRKKAARVCLSNNPKEVLDLCTGTGDLALRLARKVNGDVAITGYDFSHTMLEEAQKKQANNKGVKVAFIHGDAANMPFSDNHFDTIGISFAFRNLTFKNPDTPKFLAEVLRTLKSGGQFVIVESSQSKSRMVRAFMKVYMMQFVKRLGSWLTGDKGAYHYFAYSVVHFYSNEEIQKLLKEAGFSRVESRPMTLGTAAIHIATK